MRQCDILAYFANFLYYNLFVYITFINQKMHNQNNAYTVKKLQIHNKNLDFFTKICSMCVLQTQKCCFIISLSQQLTTSDPLSSQTKFFITIHEINQKNVFQVIPLQQFEAEKGLFVENINVVSYQSIKKNQENQGDKYIIVVTGSRIGQNSKEEKIQALLFNLQVTDKKITISKAGLFNSSYIRLDQIIISQKNKHEQLAALFQMKKKSYISKLHFKQTEDSHQLLNTQNFKIELKLNKPFPISQPTKNQMVLFSKDYINFIQNQQENHFLVTCSVQGWESSLPPVVCSRKKYTRINNLQNISVDLFAAQVLAENIQIQVLNRKSLQVIHYYSSYISFDRINYFIDGHFQMYKTDQNSIQVRKSDGTNFYMRSQNMTKDSVGVLVNKFGQLEVQAFILGAFDQIYVFRTDGKDKKENKQHKTSQITYLRQHMAM